MATVYRPLSAFARGLEKYVFAKRRTQDMRLIICIMGTKTKASAIMIGWGGLLRPGELAKTKDKRPAIKEDQTLSAQIPEGGAVAEGT